MHSCYTETKASRWKKIQRLDIYDDGSLSRQLRHSRRRPWVTQRDVIHVLAHLKAMFLPRPLFSSTFLRLTDRLGMRAWTAAASQAATSSRAPYTCLSYTPSFSSTNDLGAVGSHRQQREDERKKRGWNSCVDRGGWDAGVFTGRLTLWVITVRRRSSDGTAPRWPPPHSAPPPAAGRPCPSSSLERHMDRHSHTADCHC